MPSRPLRLESLERFGWRFGLESIQALLAELGNPQDSLQIVHVAGSNGKGSTSAFMASFLKQSGYKTGLYTSPHLCDVRERFRINGLWMSPRDFERHTQEVLRACQKVRRQQGHCPTHFEALTAIAFCWFAEQKVDWVVLEVGLGGRLDATNVIPTPALALITPIGLEHQDILGKSLEKIAFEKAGILKEGGIAATHQIHREAARVIDQRAQELGAELWLAGRDFTFRKETNGFHWEGPGLSANFKIPSLADYQVGNAALTVAGIQALRSEGVSSSAAEIRKSLAQMRWPGRLEAIRTKPLVVLDGAHNPDAAQALRKSLEEKYQGKKWIVLNGFLKDKDYGAAISILSPLTALSVVTVPPSDRGEDVEVFKAWERNGTKALFVKDWHQALGLSLRKQKASRGIWGLLITGSLYLGGACRKALMGLKGLEKL